MTMFTRVLASASLSLLVLASPAGAQLRGATPEEMKYLEAVRRAADPNDTTAPGPNRGYRGEVERQKLEQAAPNMTTAVARELVAAQGLVNDKKYPQALASAQKALAAARTDYDRLKSNQFLLVIHNNLGDTAAATAAAEAAADQAEIPDADKKDVYTSGIAMATKAGHKDKAIAYARKMAAANIDDAKSRLIISQTLYNGGDNDGARAYAQGLIDAAFARNERPQRDWIEMVLATHINARDQAGAQKALEMRAMLFNDPADWEKLTDIALVQNGVREQEMVYLGRLLLASGAKLSKENADLYGASATLLTYFGDTANAIAKGASGFPTNPQAMSEDRRTLDQQIALAAGANGAFNAKLAHVLYGYGRYAEAEAAARTALRKGGMADASEAPLALGMALTAEGKYAEAEEVLSKVTGAGPATLRTAQLWASFARAKGAPPAPAAAAN
jgi:hypothetical protein